jgi:hypothetical protein
MRPHGDQAFFGVDPNGGIDERMQALAYAVQLGLHDPWSHEWVARVVRGLPHGNKAGSDFAEVQAVFEALKRNIRYTFHPGMDRIQTLRKTLELGCGDCDNASVALATALSILNFQTAWVVMGASTPDVWDHIWAQVWLPRDVPVDSPNGRWVDLELVSGPDGTPDSAMVGWAVPYNRRAFWRRFRLQTT